MMNSDLEDELEKELSELIVPSADRKHGFKSSSTTSVSLDANGHRSKTNPPTCNYCKKTFCNLNYVKKHIARVHSKKEKPAKKLKAVEENPQDKPKSRYLRCEHCTQIFNSIAYLRKHMAIDHDMYDNNEPVCDEDGGGNGGDDVGDNDMRDSDDLVLLILNDTQAPITVGDTVKKMLTTQCNNDPIVDVSGEGCAVSDRLRIAYEENVAAMSNVPEIEGKTPVRNSLHRQVKTESAERRTRYQMEKPRHAKRRKKPERTFFEVKKLGSRGRANPKAMDELKSKTLQCKECDKKFTSTFNLKRHVKTHTDISCYKKTTKCSICSGTMRMDDLKGHYKEVHNTDFEEDFLYFASKNEFLEWKENMETETVAKYVQNQAPRVNKDGSKVTYFICHRNGYYKPKGKNVRRMKVYGSNKIDSHCPSAIVVKETSYKVTARFYKTHIGHSMDLSRLSLSNKEKEEIAQKIASKVPLEDILNDIRDSLYNEHVRRIHLTTKTDLHNLIAKFKLNRNEIKNDYEYKTVDSWVSTHLSSSMIRLYKNQGDVIDAFPQLMQQDFCLVIANDAQISLLHKYGNYVVCVDNTHGLDSLGFEMFSILVVDELGEGIPCAMMFTTRNDTTVLEVFYLVIKSALSGLALEPCYFMSDLDEASYAVWLSVFPCKETQRLLSSWHIDEAWRTQIDKIKTKEPIIKANIYKQAKLLMNEKNLLSFNMMAENFLHELFSKEETRSFASYMQVFISEPQTWAYAHRLYKGIDASIHLENMHRNLKQIFFKGRKLKRLDRGIQAIMRFVKEKMFDRLIATEKGELSRKLLDIKARHNTATEIATTMSPYIKQEGPGEWTILSKKNLKELYTVSWRKDTCNCGLRCEACDLCLHNYTCTCPDAAFHWNMCKHIHLIAFELKEQEASITACQHVDMDDNMAADDVFEMPPDMNNVTTDINTVTSDMNTVTVTVPQSITISEPITVIDSHPVTVGMPQHQTPTEQQITIEDQKADLLILVHSLLNVTDNQERVDTFRKHLQMVEQSFGSVELINHNLDLGVRDHSSVTAEPVNKKLYVHKLYLRNNGSNNQQHSDDNNT